MKVLLIYKKSSYQSRALDLKDANYLRLLKEKSAATRKSKSMHDVHMEALEAVQSHLRILKIPCDVKLRYDLKPIRGYDLAISIGGDGTFLETSHYLQDTLILGVNSVPEESVGYYCRATAESFPRKFAAFLRGRSRIKTLHRLRMTIDGKEALPLALNDVLFTSQNPAGTTRYVLKIRGTSEEQKSSGIWISPAPGSTAATRSAGGRKLPLSSQKIQYVVREPYAPPGRRYRLLKGILDPQYRIDILSVMDDAAVYIDGPRRKIPIRRGSLISLQNANRPVRAIW